MDFVFIFFFKYRSEFAIYKSAKILTTRRIQSTINYRFLIIGLSTYVLQLALFIIIGELENVENVAYYGAPSIYSRFSRSFTASFTARGYLLGNPPGYKISALSHGRQLR